MASPKIKIHSLLLATVTFLLILTVIVVKEMDLFGIPLIFAFAILFEILLIILFLYELIVVLKHPLKILGSIFLSGAKGALQDPFVLKIQEKYPHFFIGLKQLLVKERAVALILTFGLITSFLFFVFFLAIAGLLSHKNTSLVFDERILSLIPNIRTPTQTDLFSFVTFLFNWQSVLLVSLFILIFLFYKKQRFTALLFVGIMSLAKIFALILKPLFGRSRPDDSLSFISEKTYGFPSEHALFATIILGFLTYFFTHSSRHPLLKFFIFLFTIVAITLVGLSRIYMGVHYPTDLFAGILLGFSLLALFITFIEINRKHEIFEKSRSKFLHFFRNIKGQSLKGLIWVPILLVLFSVSFHDHFIQLRAVKEYEPTEMIETLDSDVINQMPKYTESLRGNPVEPISFIFIGTPESIKSAFEQKGWFKADESTISNGLRALYASFKNEPYDTGTITPAYFDNKPQTLAFQRYDKLGTFRERHHIRLWQTEYILPDGRSIWVGTASFDVGLKFSRSLLITHEIDPDIDAERKYILKSLELKNLKYIQMVKPQKGVNAFGDEFFTDGKAVIVDLPTSE